MARSRPKHSSPNIAQCWQPRGTVWRTLIKDGKSDSDIFAAKPFADLDAKWAANDQAAANFLRVVYASLKQ